MIPAPPTFLREFGLTPKIALVLGLLYLAGLIIKAVVEKVVDRIAKKIVQAAVQIICRYIVFLGGAKWSDLRKRQEDEHAVTFGEAYACGFPGGITKPSEFPRDLLIGACCMIAYHITTSTPKVGGVQIVGLLLVLSLALPVGANMDRRSAIGESLQRRLKLAAVIVVVMAIDGIYSHPTAAGVVFFGGYFMQAYGLHRCARRQCTRSGSRKFAAFGFAATAAAAPLLHGPDPLSIAISVLVAAAFIKIAVSATTESETL